MFLLNESLGKKWQLLRDLFFNFDFAAYKNQSTSRTLWLYTFLFLHTYSNNPDIFQIKCTKIMRTVKQYAK